ncbi:MAG: DNA polymerase III subunit gamma/tau [Bacteroidales bacterium]|nr:DNA polymerase III subunit gamma/tau [Bacteroidales bacterium]
MENYIVSARKYRPATFETVVGQSHITTTLKNAIKNGQLAQAFLFCGPRGVGKTTCARILAKAINCQHLTDTIEACNECESCRSFNDATSMNIFELDAASNNSVDDIRRLVEQVRIPPQSGQYKVYIIDEVHMLSTNAFNAFLKTLEEPPAYAKFILATTEKHKIIPTILSRCQIFDFKRIKIDDIAKHLEYVAQKESITYEAEALHIIAQKADGGLRDALSMFDQLVNFTGGNLSYANCIDNLNVLDYEYYFRLVDYFRSGNISNSLLLYQEILDKGFDGQHFITGLSEHIRNLMVCLDPITLSLLDVSDNIKSRYTEQANNCRLNLLLKYLDIASEYEYRYRDSNNKRLFIEVCLTKMATAVMAQQQTTTQQQAQPQPTQQPEINQQPRVQTYQKQIQQQPQQSATTATNNIAPTITPPQKVAPKVVIPTKTSTISISQNIPVVPNTENEKKNNELELTLEIVKDLWNKYSESIEEDVNLQFAMSQATIEINDNRLFTVTSDNSYMETTIKRNRRNILDFMRKKTGIKLLDFLTSVTKQEHQKVVYNPTDKFEYLKEKNSLMVNLRKTFKNIDF